MSRNNTSKLLLFTQSSGVVLNINLVLEEKSIRQDQKLRTLTQYVQKYPSGWKKRLELANLLYAMGRWEQGVEEYRQVLVQQPQLIGVRLKLGKILQLMGRNAEAIEVYESTLSVIGSSTTLHTLESTRQHILGLIAVCQNDTQGAILAFESAVSLEPSNASHWLALGQVQMEREDAVAALKAFDAVLSLKADDLVALLASYDALLLMGNYREAERRLAQAEDLAADDFRVLKRLANHRCQRRLVTKKEGKRTKQIITAALKLAPEAPDVYNLLACYHIFRGEWKKGVGVLQQFTESHPNNPNAWYYYGRCLFHTGEYQKAAEAMMSAHHLYPNDCEIYRGLCEILHHCGKCRGVTCDVSRKDFWRNTGSDISFPLLVEGMLERFPQRWSVWAMAGRVLVESLGEIERGCRVSEQGTRLQADLPDAWLCYGRVLALALKHDEAVEELEKGWELLISQAGREQGSEPKGENVRGYVQSVSAAVWLGESYQALGNEGVSRKWLEKACDLAEELQFFDPIIASYWQGRGFEGLENFIDAAEAYSSALSGQLLFPIRGEVKAAVKRMYSLFLRKSSLRQ